MQREVKQFLKPYIKEGWIASENGKHYKLTAPTGKVVTISATPSCPYYLKHALKDIEKIKREMSNGQDEAG